MKGPLQFAAALSFGYGLIPRILLRKCRSTGRSTELTVWLTWGMSRYIHKSHDVSVLLYHLVCPAKYRRVVFDEAVDVALKDVCLEIEQRYEVEFLEIGTDGDHIHFLVQSVPTYSPTKIARTIKSITAREVFARCPHVKKKLWGGEFWSDGFFIASVGQHGNENTIADYVRDPGQGQLCQTFHLQNPQSQPDDPSQLRLF